MAAPSYAPRFGFSRTPFGKGSPAVETQNSAELALQMRYLLETKGIGVVTGQAGVGKTTGVREYLRGLSPMRYRVAYVCLTTLTPLGFLQHLSDAFGLPREFSKPAIFASLQRHIASLHDAKGQVPVIVVDEADHLGNAVLHDIRMLMNFDMDSQNKAALVLAGLDRLQAMLASPQHEPLAQRVVANVRMRPLSQQEMRAYVEAKAKAAGSSLDFLGEGALQAVANAARGLPRVADQILGKACMLADAAGLKQVTKDVVKDAVGNL